MKCFISGTDTGVGKTYFTSTLLRSWLDQGHRPIGFKPISTGDRSDALELRLASGSPLPLDQINPFHLQCPLSPWISARMENTSLEISRIADGILASAAPFTHVAIEGAGGWLTPVSSQKTMADLALLLGFPVIIVTRSTLGTLNHTLLTIQSIRASGLPILGLAINHHGTTDLSTALSNEQALAELTGLPSIVLQKEGHSLLKPLPAWLST